MKPREFITSRFKRQISRLRHRRGHGVHSPYIYNIVREVFMRRRPTHQQSAMQETLIELGIQKRCAVEIENLRHHCGLSSFGVDTLKPHDMVICNMEYTLEHTLQAVKNGVESGTTIVILSPHATPQRGAMCDKIVAQHHSTTLNRRGYLVIFNNHLPKQHFVL